MWPSICKVLLFKFIFGSKQFYKQTVLKTTEIDYMNWKLDLNFKILKDQKSITISEMECFKKNVSNKYVFRNKDTGSSVVDIRQSLEGLGCELVGLLF